MADPLREALAVFIARWEARGGDADEYTRLRALLAAHPEPEPDPRACPDCGGMDHPDHWCGEVARAVTRERDEARARYADLCIGDPYSGDAYVPPAPAAVTLTLRDERNALSAELARLYRDFAPTEPPAPDGAVRVRIAVAVDADGEWAADGGSGYYEDAGAADSARSSMGSQSLRLSWVEAWVPRPAAEQVVEGRVESEFTTNDRS